MKTGRSLKTLGHVIEAVAMLAMLGTLRSRVEFWDRAGLNPNVVLPCIFGIGIACWIAGTLILRMERAKEER